MKESKKISGRASKTLIIVFDSLCSLTYDSEHEEFPFRGILNI
jgi:hypothetical protein